MALRNAADCLASLWPGKHVSVTGSKAEHSPRLSRLERETGPGARHSLLPDKVARLACAGDLPARLDSRTKSSFKGRGRREESGNKTHGGDAVRGGGMDMCVLGYLPSIERVIFLLDARSQWPSDKLLDNFNGERINKSQTGFVTWFVA